MISDAQEETAALHALGLLDADDAAAFERALAADGELRALADDLRETAASLTLAAGPEVAAPPAGLRARLLAEVGRRAPVALPGGTDRRGGRTASQTWGRWAAAAAAVVLCGLVVRAHDEKQLRQVQFHVAELQDVSRRQTLMIQQVEAARQRLELAQTSASPLTQVAVCPLEPTPDGPGQPRAAILWDPSRHAGQLVIVRLKAPAAGHDYQLWAVEEGRKDPVSAGLVRVDAEGRAQVTFKPAGGSEKVLAFALSLEAAGGSEKNQGPILLLGKL